MYVEDAPTMHRSATQKTVALSSCKAELNATVLCVQDMIYQKNTLELIGLKVEYPMVLEMDNRSENEADIFTKNLDGPIFKCYADLLLGKGSVGGKGDDTE